MNLIYSEFKRKFSMSMYKNLKICLGKMTFSKDFVNDTRGDMYPVIQKSQDCAECVEYNLYKIENGSVKRISCQFFPYATYELTANVTGGEVGFCFKLPDAEATISASKEKLVYSCENKTEEVSLPEFVKNEFTMIVSCRPKAFDVYFINNGKPEYTYTFCEDKFENSNDYTAFSNGYVLLSASGNVLVKDVLSYIDNGVSIADIRPIKYENGDILIEQGKIYITASIRMQEGTFQGIFSWVPGTAEFNLTGALFFDCGDNKWRNYVASAILYHREEKKWYIWTSAFEHKKVLAHSEFEGDPRFGVNVVDVTLMGMATDDTDYTAFSGFTSDEDPDFFYHPETKKWTLAICRIMPETKRYSYVFFESLNPFDGYTYIGRGEDGAETGGSFVKINGECFFVCGNGFGITSQYRIYSKNNKMQIAQFNHPDGGFRGWGTVIPIKMGSRIRYFWLTFDRHNGSSYPWSYGNIYCFEADEN